MDALNSVESRKLTPAQSMQRLERSVLEADQRLAMRRTMNARVSSVFVLLTAIPLWSYLIFNFFAPHGVMQNYKQSSGAYLYWAQNFMLRFKPQAQVYRPEMYFKETSGSLAAYSKKIKEKREKGELPEGVHHPEIWH